ncbi:MAG: phosphoenolpyruvate synthase, partial [Ruminiclostridium sp.]|nr:phosphoenolpyruvate synthase [Ruminiclostridium sp.]
RLAELDTDKLDTNGCADELEGIIKLEQKLCYGRFKYALFPAFFTSGGLAKLLKKIDKELTPDDLYGGLEYKTALVSRDIAGLAKAITGDPALRRDVEDGMTYESVRAKYPAMAKMFDEFMKNNGYKLDFNCYCIYSRSFIEAPQRLMGIIRPLIGTENSQDDGSGKFADIMSKLEKICGEKKFEKVKENVEYHRYFHVMREESQYMWEEIFFRARRVLERTALLLCGETDCRESIAYLFFDELISACRRGGLNEDDKAKINLRKGNRPLAEKVWERCKLEAFDMSGDVLKGTGGSRGEAVGPARVIRGPEEFYKMQKGDILVCPYTDPEWTPLFRLAAGVVADTGASLSHAAIVAREYGIPAVLGVGYATAKLRDGDMVAVNGTTGEARKVE